MRAADTDHVGRTLAEHGVAVASTFFAGKVAGFAKQAQSQWPALLTRPLLADLVLNARLTTLLEKALGPSFVVARVHVGVGASGQLATTAARARLFADEAANARVPMFSLSMFSPVQACTVVVTAHDLQQEIALLPGDALFVDSRCHARVEGGAPAAVFVTYARPWFREPPASPLEPPVQVSSIDFLRLPLGPQARLQWRFDRYLKQRHRLLAYRVADKIPAGLGAPLKRALRGWASSY